MIIIDAGHGGTDKGVNGNNIVEKDFNQKISDYMSRRFNELNIPVALTRTDDTTISDDQRIEKINSLAGTTPGNILISNHLNDNDISGAEIIYSLKNRGTLAKYIVNNLLLVNQNTNRYYQRRLKGDTSKDFFRLLREMPDNVEGIIVEYASVNNSNDADKLNRDWIEYAESVIKAIATYKKLNYIPPISENTYTVKVGESIYSIAEKFGITVDEIKEANSLISNFLNIGQVLKIPVPPLPPLPLPLPAAPEYTTYTVKSGDNLYDIARRYNTSATKIKELNNLANIILDIGQVLKIPK